MNNFKYSIEDAKKAFIREKCRRGGNKPFERTVQIGFIDGLKEFKIKR